MAASHAIHVVNWVGNSKTVLSRQACGKVDHIRRSACSIKKPNLIAIVGRFLPVWFFSSSSVIPILSVHRLSTVTITVTITVDQHSGLGLKITEEKVLPL